MSGASELERMMLLSDPQTSGGLLIAVAPESLEQAKELINSSGDAMSVIGTLRESVEGMVVQVR